MKQKFFTTTSKKRYALNWLLIYFVVLLFGILFSLLSTSLLNHNSENIAKFDMQHYIENGDFNPNVAIHGAYNVVFDEHVQLVNMFPNKNIDDFWQAYAEKIYPKVLAQGELYTIKIRPEITSPIVIVCAYPMETGGMFLFFKYAYSFNKTIFIIFFTVTLLITLMAIYVYKLIQIEQSAKKMQRDYVDNITHELKSPISSVRALTETMYDGLIRDEAKRKQYYKIILHEISGLENTITNMLELSKIQNNQMDCSKTLISAYDVFGDIAEKYATLCDNNEMKFSISPSLSQRCILYTNESLASRIMDILLDNAVKFAGEKGTIHIELTDEGNVLTISIIDNGTGITPEDQKQIFSRFYKGDKSHNEKGSGLGLAIASEIANCLDEKLWLSSTGPDGTAFSFTIHKN